jgi:DedD protein
MVGAAVLVATAILLIPEMLSGPRTMPPVPPDAKATTSDDAPIAAPADTSKLKTYTIDLSKSGPSAATAPEPKSEQAPTFAASTAEPTKGLNKEHVVTTPAPPAENRSPNPDPRPPSAAPTAQVVAKPTPQPARSETARTTSGTAPANAVATEGWTVQVGSFGVRATSDRIAADLKHEGFSAFVVAFQSGNQTMYRVRVGPERDRASAEALLRKLKAGHPTATLVPPP